MSDIHIFLKNRDEVYISKKANGRYSFKAVGCTLFLRQLTLFFDLINKEGLESIEEPQGNGHIDILIREILAKLKGEWNFPCLEEELCHCRKISTSDVDQAIVSGIHKLKGIGEECSAGITCGSCQPDIEKLLSFRLR